MLLDGTYPRNPRRIRGPATRPKVADLRLGIDGKCVGRVRGAGQPSGEGGLGSLDQCQYRSMLRRVLRTDRLAHFRGRIERPGFAISALMLD